MMTNRKQRLRGDIEERLRSFVDQFAAALREELCVRPRAAIEDRTVIKLSAYRLDKRVETFGSATELATAIRYVELSLEQFVPAAIGMATQLDFSAMGRSLLGLEVAINQIKIATQGYDADDQALLLEWRRRLLLHAADLHRVITWDEDRWAALTAEPTSDRLADVICLADHHRAAS